MWRLLTVLVLFWVAPVVAQRTDLPQQDMGVLIATHYGSGTCTAATLNAAISAIGTTQTTLVIPPVPRNSVTPCIWNLTSTVTVPANILLHIPRGVILTPSTGITLTLNGPIENGPYQIFNANGTSTGTVFFGFAGLVHAEWWGAKGDNSTDSAPAITRALQSGLAMVVQLQGGVFRLGSAITPPISDLAGWILNGAGRGGTTLTRTAGYTGTLINVGDNATASRNTRIRNLGLDCLDRAAGTKGIRLALAPRTIIEDVDIRNCDYGIHQSGGLTQVFRDIHLEDNNICFQIDNEGNRAVVDAKLENIFARGCRVYGLNIDGAIAATGLVREISVYNLTTDKIVTAGGNTCLRIHAALRLRFYGTHLELCDPHLSVTGATGHLTQNLVFYGTNLGNLNIPNDGAAIQWNTAETNDGIGSSFQDLTVLDGSSNFVSDHVVNIRNGAFPNNNAPTGNGYVLRNNDQSIDDTYTRDAARDSWTIFKAEKRPASHTSIYQRRFGTEDSTGSALIPIVTVVMGANSSHIFESVVMGKRQNGADQAVYRLLCLFTTNADASATTLVASDLTPTLESTGATGWAVSCGVLTGAPGAAGGQVLVTNNDPGYTVRWAASTDVLQINQENP